MSAGDSDRRSGGKAAANTAAGTKVAAKKAAAKNRPAGSKLGEYRRKRDAARTPEPVPPEAVSAQVGRDSSEDAAPDGSGDTFVIQEHHATSLHWDLRLERDGVLVSWAVPRGLPPTPQTNHLAVHTEDHPMEYAEFSGEIPKGEYGGGTMTIWDRGSYRCEKWSDREVKVVLDGERVQGRFVLFQTDGKNWMVHRMDAPVRPDWRPLPTGMPPMLAVPGRMPSAREDPSWCYEFDWPGFRVLAGVDGGRVRVLSAEGADVTSSLPELRGLGEQLGLTQVLVDGVLVAFDPSGRPALERIRARIGVTGAQARSLSRQNPAVLLITDVLHLDGRSILEQPYSERRGLLEELALGGPGWKTAPSFAGGGAAVRAAAREQQFAGLLAKRANSPYRPGTRSPDWRAIRA
jgi:bifunctional non-homologous end joining protein LigD